MGADQQLHVDQRDRRWDILFDFNEHAGQHAGQHAQHHSAQLRR